jgi:hypothetical protein
MGAMPVASSSPTELELKGREVMVQEQELRLKQQQFDHERSKGPLGNVAVAVTVIAGMAAVIFQGIGAYSAHQEQVAAATNRDASADRASKELDLKGIELFVTTEEKVIGCDPNAADAQVSLFTSVFPKLMVRFRAAASSKAQHCATESANAAAGATAKGAAPQAVAAAADNARYSTMSNFAPAVSQPTTNSSSPVSTVYLQIADNSQRGQALALQQALVAAGYSCPGIQLVAAAPKAPQLRIYREDERPAASKLAGIIAATLHIQQPDVRSLQKQYQNLPSGVVEYWFPGVPAAG